MLITDIDRNQRNRTRAATQHRLNGHRQRTGFRIQQTPRTGTTAFHEVLDGITTAEQFAEILTENGGIELIAFKSTANKERTQTAENRPGRPEVQVDPGGDMRRHQPLVIQHVRKQQVVHVTAVARHIYQLMTVVGQLANALGVMDVDALVKAVPGKAQNTVSQADHLVREIRRNLFHQRNRVLLRFFMGDFFAARFIFYRFRNSAGGEQLIKQILTSRQTWAYGSQTLTGKVHTRHARQFLRDSFIRAVFIRHTAQRN